MREGGGRERGKEREREIPKLFSFLDPVDGGGRGLGGGAQGSADKGLDPGNMEGWVDAAKGRREVQADCRGIYHFGDGVGADEAWIHLRGGHLQGNISGG